MTRDPAAWILHPRHTRGRGLAIIALTALAVIVGLVAMHAPSGAMLGASMDSGTMGAGADARPVAAVSTGHVGSSAAPSAQVCECTTDQGCAEAMSSMACPLAPAPTHTLQAPNAALLRSPPPGAAGVAIHSGPLARPVVAPDLIRLSISRT